MQRARKQREMQSVEGALLTNSKIEFLLERLSVPGVAALYVRLPGDVKMFVPH